MLLQLVLISVVVWVAYLRWTRRKKILCFQQFKNEVPSLPVIGHAYLFTGTGEAKMKGMQTLGLEAVKQGGVTVMQSWLLDAFYAMVADAEVAEVILRNCLEKDDSMKTMKFIFGNGLLVSDVPEWRLRRKTLNPAFTQKYLNQNVDIFHKNSSILADKLKHISKTGPFSIYNYIIPYALDSVFESIYAFEIGAQKNPQHPVMQALSVCCELISNRLCLPWLHNQVVYEMTSQCATLKKNAELIFDFIDENNNSGKWWKEISPKLYYVINGTGKKLIRSLAQKFFQALKIYVSVFQKIVKKCKEFRSNADSKAEDMLSGKPKKTSKSMLQLMVETSSNANETLSDEYLREETFVVTFAGTDTTSVGLSFIFAMLARHPDVQERVYQEIMEVIGDEKKPVEADDLPQLKYTEAVIKETLRMYPPAPLMLRKVDKDITLPSGKYLVAGTGVMINIWAVHHNPKYWDEPEQFRPERFLDAKPKHPAAFLAFSYGVRNCIGAQYAMMSLKTSLSTLIRQYRVLPANDDPKAEQAPLRTEMDVMMRDVDNFIVQLVPRF